MAVFMIYKICQKNPRRIKTMKFDEEDYLINGIIWGPIINDLSDFIISISFLCIREGHYRTVCEFGLNIYL